MNEQNVVSWMIAGGDRRTVGFTFVRAVWRTIVTSVERRVSPPHRHAAPVTCC